MAENDENKQLENTPSPQRPALASMHADDVSPKLVKLRAELEAAKLAELEARHRSADMQGDLERLQEEILERSTLVAELRKEVLITEVRFGRENCCV